MRGGRRWACVVACCALFVVVVPTFGPGVSGLTFEVPARMEECMEFFVPVEVTVLISWTAPDVYVDIYGTDEKPVIRRRFEMETASESLSSIEAGFYRICFDNRHSRMTPHVVQFEVSMEGALERADPMDLMIGSSIETIEESLHSISESQEVFKTRETRHQKTTESTLSRINWYSSAICCVMVVATWVQLFILKGWFHKPEKKSPQWG
ncbi:emp24/gp25L/p24 family/GOLD [Pelomyxa schiedti]|nr:emp24/gp25L/p24 family/GOLD [Pelomyxa schiedti]